MTVHKNTTIADYIVSITLYILLGAFAIITVLPLINVIASSFSNPGEIASTSFLLIPKHPTLNSYKYIFASSTTVRALLVSTFITLSGTLISMVLSTITAYALANKFLVFRKSILLSIIITMLINPGIIANYITFRAYGLMNSYWALVLPRAINVFYLLLLKNFFSEIPSEMKEAATIDGCGTYGILIRIVLPLSLPALATFTLFYAVDNWNSFFDALLYISDSKKSPITIIMRQVILMASGVGGTDVASEVSMSPTSMRMATVAVAILPILGSYPFLQRYFQSGLMAGGIKG